MISPSTAATHIIQDPTASDAGDRREYVSEEREGLDAWLQAVGAFLVYTATWYNPCLTFGKRHLSDVG